MRSTSAPPTRTPPRASSALSYDHGGDTGSDIYVTSAAYKAPSEIRYVSIYVYVEKIYIILKVHWPINLFKWD